MNLHRSGIGQEFIKNTVEKGLAPREYAFGITL
jgi:hypothetical protein